MTDFTDYIPPKAFVSYSHDSDTHKAWVLTLATRLRSDGVDITLDRWDLSLGTDVARFMEKGVVGAVWFIAVCTPRYVVKANEGVGGSGYEKTILAPSLMKSTDEKHVIPLWRDNPERDLPIFVGARLAADFNDDANYEDAYANLIRTIHGQDIVPKPPIGSNPFAPRPIDPKFAYSPNRYVNPNISGTVTFDYSNNDGRFVIGTGDLSFETRWSSAGATSIHAYHSGGTKIALALGVENLVDIYDARAYDFSSSSRTPRIGDLILLENEYGYFAAVMVQNVMTRGHNGNGYEVTFGYWIQPDHSPDLRSLAG